MRPTRERTIEHFERLDTFYQKRQSVLAPAEARIRAWIDQTLALRRWLCATGAGCPSFLPETLGWHETKYDAQAAGVPWVEGKFNAPSFSWESEAEWTGARWRRSHDEDTWQETWESVWSDDDEFWYLDEVDALLMIRPSGGDTMAIVLRHGDNGRIQLESWMVAEIPMEPCPWANGEPVSVDYDADDYTEAEARSEELFRRREKIARTARALPADAWTRAPQWMEGVR